MKPSDFNEAQRGDCRKTLEGYHAFYPRNNIGAFKLRTSLSAIGGTLPQEQARQLILKKIFASPGAARAHA